MNVFTHRRNQKNTSIVQNSNNNKISREEFFNIIKPIIENEKVQQMKLYKQHCNTSCYTHCLHVAYYSYVIAKKFHLDYISIARAAMLHDLFLYDWRTKHRDEEFYGLHAFMHPKIALRNSLEVFNLNSKEQDIISKHMWPLTITFPKYIESYIVSFMDKFSAIRESYAYMQTRLKRKTVYKYAYIFLSLILFRVI